MSTATIEEREAGKAAYQLDLLQDLLNTRTVEKGWSGERRERFTSKMGKGATTYEVNFHWPENPADRMEDQWENGYAVPRVAIIKANKTSQHVINWIDAPKYVQDYVHTMRRELAKHEHARHGVAPISYAAQERWNKHGLKTGAEIRRAEHYLKTIERPGVRRTQAQEIAAEMVHSFIERAEHEALMTGAKRDHDEVVRVIERDHDEALAEAAEVGNVEAGEVVKEFDRFMDRLDEPDLFAYAYGATTVEKIKDLARDAIDAIERYEVA